ncbi:pseudouridine-5'-phosphatase isoform X1 [Rhizophagus clarus]|uniref:Pseudouridine-5'-phosphatase isoform X1 n=1 Tax=Rhizophagus clarus TaxID=94130 RepID=A0A8H3LAH0_9GLOM|nr:pseudouridine-5'-phosphatase isoform X1 [Rhizophagus clarus]
MGVALGISMVKKHYEIAIDKGNIISYYNMEKALSIIRWPSNSAQCNLAKAIIIAKITEKYGKTLSPKLSEELLGLTSVDYAKKLIDALGIIVQVEEFIEERQTLIVSIELVATSSSRENYLLKVRNHKDLFNLFDYVVCGIDIGIKNVKPEPDLFSETWKKFGHPQLNECLVFEDAVNGIKAAMRECTFSNL